MEWPGIDTIRERILRSRAFYNRNNLTRTNYYYTYWKKHQEIPWSLMANLVSRNAGYQMSDLERYYQLASSLDLLLSPTTFSVKLGCAATFAYLETGNFLILRDVLPCLEAYRWAKLFPSYVSAIFTLLAEPKFGTDPFIIQQWELFFDQASQSDWFANWRTDPRQYAIIERHTFALVTNEQNQIEDRLVNPGISSRYLGPLGLGINVVIAAFAAFGLTRLVVPLDNDSTRGDSQLLIYSVTDFLSLAGRIETGRNLFANLFSVTQERVDQIMTWCDTYPYHTASRSDYNTVNFTLNPEALTKSGPIYYSPALIPAWPISCLETKRYSHLHQCPIPLPIAVRDRVNYEQWLETPTNPAAATVARLDDVAELSDATLVTRPLEIAKKLLRKIF